ncbi:unnamed protein product [Cylicocyclus nassatus]|uniref:Neurotransmitter-gated ion-channel ligand-binding domain-containing protein n=1 Tax=Cylicocyclus nassatus TaxID=53992 RepID=A0AA36M2C2_CYLNA|nr:unnamed protein product [Cylicocyclus nassatus]
MQCRILDQTSIIVKPIFVNITLASASLLSVDWNDERLSWNPSNFDEINGFYINQSFIWQADVLAYNSRSFSGITSAPQHVYVHSNGDINSFVYNTVSFTCLMNASMRDFPFDKQLCSVEFTSYTFSSRELQIDCSVPEDFGHSSASNNEWIVDGITCSTSRVQDEVGPEYYLVKFTFQMRRFCLIYVVTIILPSFVLTLLCVLGMFWSRVNHDDYLTKIGCGLSAIVAMCTILQIAGQSMPKTRELPSLFYIMANLMLISVSITVITTASKPFHLPKFKICYLSQRWFRRLDFILNVEFEFACLLVFLLATVANLLMLASRA